MDTLLADIRYGFRRLLTSPATSLVAILSLAIGIGANTSIFSAINALLLKPLPFEDPDRLVRLFGVYPAQGEENKWSISYPNLADYRTQSRSFVDVAAHQGVSFNLTGVDRPEHVRGARTTAPFFTVLGVRPVLGRGYLPEEDRPDAGDRVVVISHGFWTERYARDPAVIGRTVTLNGTPHMIIGVMPEEFGFPSDEVELWTPLRHDETTWGRASGGLNGVARLRPGVTLEEARQDLANVARRLEQEYPEANEGLSASATSLKEAFYGPEVQLALLVLLGAVGLVLLIACINVANLLLARSVAREKEIAIRAAIGAGRRRVVRQLLTESMILAGVGGLLGVLLSIWGVSALRGVAAAQIPRGDEITLDPAVLLFALLITGVTGVVFGLGPAIHGSRTELSPLLREATRGSTSGHRSRVRAGLVIGEVALALMLLVGGGLLIRSLGNLLEVDTGFDPEGVLTFELTLDPRYETAEQVRAFHDRLRDEITSLPGVVSTGAVDWLPLGGTNNYTYLAVEGRPAATLSDQYHTGQLFVSPGYFASMGIALRRGRTFEPTDVREAPGVVILNEQAATYLWPGEDPLGKRLAFTFESGDSTYWRTVVGVVENVRHHGLDESTRPEVYSPIAQLPWPLYHATIVIRAAGDPQQLGGPVREAVLRVDPGQPIFNVRTMSEVIRERVAISRLIAWLLGLFGGAALVLAGIGLYGVISYSVAQRTHEIGIRTALGADSPTVLRMILWQGMRLVLLGVAVGAIAALLLSRVLQNLLFEVRPADPATYIGVVAILAGIGLLATYLPARRAIRVNPLEALRAEV